MATLESLVEQLIGALDRNTEAHGGKAAGKPATAAAKPAGTKPAEGKITGEMVKAAVLGVRDAFDKPQALALIKKHAKANEIAAIKPAFYAAVMEACEEKMATLDAGGDEATTDDDEL